MQEGGRSRMKTKHVTHEPKGLEGGTCVGMELRMGNVECLKDTHGEVIKGQGDMEVRKKTRIYKEQRTIIG